ncbi:unnamed protein product [Camellia sinensis]
MIPNPNLPGHLLLEQYQAQLVSAVRIALGMSSGPILLEAGLQLATKILTNGIISGDQIANGYHARKQHVGVPDEYLAQLPLFSESSSVLGKYWISILKDYSYVCFRLHLKQKWKPFLDGIQSPLVSTKLQPCLEEAWPVILQAVALDAVPVHFDMNLSSQTTENNSNNTFISGYSMVQLKPEEFQFLWGFALLVLKGVTSTVEKEILNGISGSVNPGEVLALMGPSGSGKTTLLSLLGGRVRESTPRGSITYNDQPYSKFLKSRIGFLTQDDVLFPHLIVRETLTYVALLRLPKTLTKQEKEKRAIDVNGELGLERCQDAMIGSSFVRGVSGEERKRVCIGNEIIINPSLLFLDEPTSGLDSTTASRIVQILQDIAEGGNDFEIYDSERTVGHTVQI